MQVKLLRVLQEREFERIGGNQTIKMDVRVIAATNRDIEKDIREGKFREDLYYRLNVVSVVIPPLRDRKEDIPALMEHFIKKYGTENKKVISGVAAGARDRDAICTRERQELENIIERAVVLAKRGTITVSDLPCICRAPTVMKALCSVKGTAQRNTRYGGARSHSRCAERVRRHPDPGRGTTRHQ
jgi:transcriptional regulator with GAF, ATPase, and Fis domain